MRRGTALLLSKVFAPRLFKGVPWARHSDNRSLLCYHVNPSMRNQAVAAVKKVLASFTHRIHMELHKMSLWLRDPQARDNETLSHDVP
jgi:hypothetical protein